MSLFVTLLSVALLSVTLLFVTLLSVALLSVASLFVTLLSVMSPLLRTMCEYWRRPRDDGEAPDATARMIFHVPRGSGAFVGADSVRGTRKRNHGVTEMCRDP